MCHSPHHPIPSIASLSIYSPANVPLFIEIALALWQILLPKTHFSLYLAAARTYRSPYCCPDRIIPPRFIGIEHLSFFVNIQATIKPSGILHHHCPLVRLYYCLQSFTITMLHVRRILYGSFEKSNWLYPLLLSFASCPYSSQYFATSSEARVAKEERPPHSLTTG